jgi:hypothetical protein
LTNSSWFRSSTGRVSTERRCGTSTRNINGPTVLSRWLECAQLPAGHYYYNLPLFLARE